jgi:hypothetical protein
MVDDSTSIFWDRWVDVLIFYVLLFVSGVMRFHDGSLGNSMMETLLMIKPEFGEESMSCTRIVQTH